jgi:hypothetical protein
MRLLIATLAFITFSIAAYAHGGGLDANRCHNDYVHGGYHCH